MKRRWIIRGLFMLPILLCIIGWGWSVKHHSRIFHARTSDVIFCGTKQAIVYFEDKPFQNAYKLHGWHAYTSENEAQFWPQNGHGFHSGKLPDDDYILYIPYWFLVIIFSLVLLFVWRKTGPKPQGGAFPVEVAEKPPDG